MRDPTQISCEPDPPSEIGPEEVSTGRAVVNGTRWLTVSQISVQVLKLGTMVVLARLLEVEDFGLLALGVAVTALLDRIVDLGTGAAIIQRATVSNRLLSTVFYVNMGTAAALSLAVFLLASPLAVMMGDQRAGPVLRVLAPAVLLTGLGVVHQALLRRQMRFDVIARISIASTVMGSATSIAMAFAGHGVWSLVAGILATQAASSLLTWASSPWRPTLAFDGDSGRSLLSFSTNLSASNIVHFALGHVDKIVVANLLGLEAVGFYMMVQRLTVLPTERIMSIVNQVLFPALSRARSNADVIADYYVRVSASLALVVIPMMVGMAAVAGPLVKTLLGAEWGPAVGLIVLMAPASAIQAIASPSVTLLLSRGLTNRVLRWTTVRAIVLGGALVAGASLGLTGLAWSYLLASIILSLLAMSIPVRLLPLEPAALFRSLVPTFTISAIMAIAVASAVALAGAIGTESGIALAIGIAVGVLVFGFQVRFAVPFGIRDLARVLPVPQPRWIPAA